MDVIAEIRALKKKVQQLEKRLKGKTYTIPDTFSDVLREATESWLEYKAGSLTAVGTTRAITRIYNVAQQEGEEVVIEALDVAQGNGWKGWDFPDKRQTKARNCFSVTASTMEERLRELEDEQCQQNSLF